MTFSVDDVLRAAREVVQEKGPDYVYPESEKRAHPRHRAGESRPVCQYSHNGAPSCIVGHIIFKLDPQAFKGVVEREETYGTAEVEQLRFNDTLPEDFWTDDADSVLGAAQRAQDEGSPWGDALAFAESVDY